jgi:hypothetical protein
VANDALLTLGYRRVSGAAGCPNALFAVPTGIHLLAAEYANDRGETVVANFVITTSDATISRARNAFFADATAAGFGPPAIDGNRFYGRTALRSRGTQKDFAGWIVPGVAVIAVQRFVKLPLKQDARAFLDDLTNR